ncbi:dephospho-CoA kinase [bacterium]|nr:dephospho-CoA kinase [bacterium]
MMKRPLIIGITGSIASGKSQVVKVLQEAAYKVYSTDELGHQVLQMDQVKDKLVSKFGKEILSGDNTIDRSKLGEFVFADKANLDYLNSLSHPQIFALMNKIINQSRDKYIFFEVPLLFEAKLSDHFDFIITVSASEENQVLRLKQRNSLTADNARRKISTQLPNKIKEEKADFVIKNDGDLLELQAQVQALITVLPQIKTRNIKQF